MKKRTLFFLLLLFIFSKTFASSHGHTLHDHSKIQFLSSFKIIGEIELRSEKNILSPVSYRTLSHEGGMRVTVMEILNRDKYKDKEGIWLYVLLTYPLWADDGSWIKENSYFLIFLPDEMPVFDFEE